MATTAPSPLIHKTIIGAAWLLLWRVITRSLGLVNTLALARLLMPSDFGLVAMAMTFSYSVEALSQLGLPEALIRRREEGYELHHAAFTLQLGRAITTGLVIAACAPAAVWWFSEPRLAAVLWVLAGMTALNGLENVGMAEYRRALRFDVQFRLMLISRLAGFATTVGCALLGGGYWALLTGMVMSSVIRIALSYRLHPFRPRLQLTRWRELAGFSVWIWATAAASLVWDRCDPFVLGSAFGPTKLGLYLLAMEIALLPVTELVAPAAEVLFGVFASTQKDGDSSLHHAPMVAGMILLGVAPVVLGISASAGPIVEVMLGAKWVEAGPIVAVLSWACVFSPFSYICGNALVANGHVKRNFAANVAVSAIKLVALLVAVSRTTDPVVIGAVSAGCVAVESVMFLSLLRGIGDVRFRPALGNLGRVAAATALAAAVLRWSGLGWRKGMGSTLADIAQGCMIGGLGVTVFTLVMLLLWQIAGRPEGAESRLVGLARARVARSFVRCAI